MLTITVDLQVEKELLELSHRVPGAVKHGLEAVGAEGEKLARKEAQKIYARPIPRRKNGKAMWERSGDLLDSIGAKTDARGTKVALTADAPYALARNALGVDWTPRNPALGVIRKNPFMSDAAAQLEPKASAIFADGVEEYLNR